jgi:hypothetical protein
MYLELLEALHGRRDVLLIKSAGVMGGTGTRGGERG